MTTMDIPSEQFIAHEVLTLHMELQATEKNWEWKYWSFSEKEHTNWFSSDQ